jgi:PAS domain S-box-containing protein
MNKLHRRARHPELWIPLVYAVFAGVWIYSSDSAVAAIARSVERQRILSVYKGFGFVAVTAVLLFAGIRAALRRDRQGARRVAESEALLRAITDAIPDPVYLKDLNGRWVFANPAAVSVGGAPDTELIGKTVADIFDPATSAILMETDRRIMERGVPELIEERLPGPGGDRIFLSSKAPYRDASGSILGLVGTSREITDRKKAEHDLRAAEERLRQAQKLESIGRLAGGVAHDFNNLLTVILSYTDSLEAACRKGEPGDLGELGEIRQAGERARDLTRRLLAFARKQTTSPVRLDLGDAIGATQTFLRRLLGDDVELRVKCHPDLWPVLIDPGHVEQVLLNLAINARDAMPEGGTLLIEARNVDGVERGGWRRAERPGDWVRIVVRDSGVGMGPDVRAHLFEPFFTTKEQRKGTGLGLAMVHGIVTQAGGHVHVDSTPGKGTAFEIDLPRLADAGGRRERLGPDVTKTRRNGSEAVLVVEDDEMVRSVMVRSLRGAGYRVREESNPTDALENLRENLDPLHLLVTDVQMPGRSGPSMAAEIRRLRPDIRVLFVSGYPGDALDRGAQHDGFLPKPFTPELLLARVRSILDAPIHSGRDSTAG